MTVRMFTTVFTILALAASVRSQNRFSGIVALPVELPSELRTTLKPPSIPQPAPVFLPQPVPANLPPAPASVPQPATLFQTPAPTATTTTTTTPPTASYGPLIVDSEEEELALTRKANEASNVPSDALGGPSSSGPRSSCTFSVKNEYNYDPKNESFTYPRAIINQALKGTVAELAMKSLQEAKQRKSSFANDDNVLSGAPAFPSNIGLNNGGGSPSSLLPATNTNNLLGNLNNPNNINNNNNFGNNLGNPLPNSFAFANALPSPPSSILNNNINNNNNNNNNNGGQISGILGALGANNRNSNSFNLGAVPSLNQNNPSPNQNNPFPSLNQNNPSPNQNNQFQPLNQNNPSPNQNNQFAQNNQFNQNLDQVFSAGSNSRFPESNFFGPERFGNVPRNAGVSSPFGFYGFQGMNPLSSGNPLGGSGSGSGSGSGNDVSYDVNRNQGTKQTPFEGLNPFDIDNKFPIGSTIRRKRQATPEGRIEGACESETMLLREYNNYGDRCYVVNPEMQQHMFVTCRLVSSFVR
ncbi:hypothetical protein V1264_004688 [Littorina saxatilis]|uniref:Uncharacterized protein n=1 Tax=Littorina saxatilis TaxID=31220 RepID=A0AAN9B202_9CAEN